MSSSGKQHESQAWGRLGVRRRAMYEWEIRGATDLALAVTREDRGLAKQTYGLNDTALAGFSKVVFWQDEPGGRGGHGARDAYKACVHLCLRPRP